jgi:competence ComEA-like helix-hairpin-helix protein
MACIPILRTDTHFIPAITGPALSFIQSDAVYQVAIKKSPRNKKAPQRATVHSSKKIKNIESCVNINSADAPLLMTLPSVGPVLAQRIIDERTHRGRFSNINELDGVKGIGPATLEKLHSFICF